MIWSDALATLIRVPISALEHFSYCPRQCALIHIEQSFEENVFTVRGRLAHERVESGVETSVSGVSHVRSLPLWSDQHGLIGKADVVEFHRDRPYPVEYKAGATGRHAAVQLCAQALCLEEMLGVAVPEGALYSHARKRRTIVTIDKALRNLTMEILSQVRQQIAGREMPMPVNDARCANCSLLNLCLPTVVGRPSRIRGYQGSIFRPASEGSDAGWFDV